MKPANACAQQVTGDPEGELARFIAKFEPAVQNSIRAIRRALRKRLPAANELVYDNYNFFVIGYCTSERASDAVLSMVADRKGVRLAFPYTGSRLPDPHELLRGSGTQNRALTLESAARLADPRVEALIEASIRLVKAAPPANGKGKLIIRSVSAKQRPRRKANQG